MFEKILATGILLTIGFVYILCRMSLLILPIAFIFNLFPFIDAHIYELSLQSWFSGFKMDFLHSLSSTLNEQSIKFEQWSIGEAFLKLMIYPALWIASYLITIKIDKSGIFGER